MTAPEDVALLEQLTPVLRYDSQELFFADGAEQWTACPGNELRRADGSVLARAPFELSFLGPKTYADGQPVKATDRIGHTGRDYRGSYERLRAERLDLNDVVYGRIVQQGGQVWAQYWLWYFANGGLSRHEGDWECVQYRITEGTPDLAVYAQHRRAEARPWPRVRQVDGHPIVFVATATHASLFDAGVRGLDRADGHREVRPRLEVIAAGSHDWMLWPGRFGDTRGRPDRPWESTSPPAPGRALQWRKPSDWAQRAAMA